MAWEIEKHQITSYDEGRYRVRVKQKPRDQVKPDIESIKLLIHKLLEEELKKQQENEDELIQKLKKDKSLRVYTKEMLRNIGIPFKDEE